MNVSVQFSVYTILSPLDLSLLVLLLVLYFVGLLVTLFLVVTIVRDPRLHRPMYVLLAHLSLCSVLGGSSLCPTVLRFLVFGQMSVSLNECLSQVLFTNLYSGCVYCLLGLMAFDRYVAICLPLRYHAIVTPTKLRIILLCVYSFLISGSVVLVYLTSRVRLCRFTVDKLMCDPLAISNLACERTFAVSAFGLFGSLSVIVVPCFLTILSYAQIFVVILKSSSDSQRTVFVTCAPHIITFTNYSVASFFGVISRRVNDEVPKTLNIVVCLVFLIFPPLLNPIVYGIRMKEIQLSFWRSVHKRVGHV